MTKSSFELIQQSAGTNIAGKTKKITRQVAGFDVEEEVPLLPPHVAKNFDIDSSYLRKTLASADIEPLAVLPRNWWKQIVRRAKLVDFAPTATGTVHVNVGKHVLRVKDGDFIFCAFALAAVCLFPLVLGGYWWFGYPINSFGTEIVAALISCSLTLMFSCYRSKFAWWASLLYVWRMGGNHAILGSLFDDDEVYSSGRRSIGITLPIPPVQVADVLLKAERADINMRVSAVPQAVALALSPRQLIQRELIKQWDDEAIERRAARAAAADPIIYVAHGSAVAIIAQFGDFPIEQEIVDEVVRRA